MMVFDFIRKRAEEGIAQVQNIASKTAEGKLAEALEDTANYVRTRQEIDAENIRKLSEGLAKSRQRLMGDLDSIFGATEDLGLTKTLDKLEEVLMMADIGATTTEEIIDDLRAVAKAEQLIEPEDVKSVLRLRLVEALSAQDRSVRLQRPGAGGEQPTTSAGKVRGWG